jgi:nitrate/nitrite-specific signal transduction histidine kinase
MDDQASPISSGFPIRLGRRFSYVLVIIIIVMLLAGGVSLYLGMRIYQINREYDQEYTHAQMNDEIYLALQRIIAEVQHIQATGEFERTDRVRALLATLTRSFKAFVDFHSHEAHSADEALEGPLVEQLPKIQADLADLSDRVTAKLARRTYLDPIELDQLRHIVDLGTEVSQDLRQFHSKRVVRMSQKSQALIRRNVMLYLVSLAIGGMLVGLTSLVLHRKIVAPLAQVAGTALRIAEGRQGERVLVRSRDEIGQLSHSFNTMVERLEERERDLRSAQTQLEKKIREARALYQIGTEISSLQQLDSILDSVVGNAVNLLGGEAAAICLLTPAQNKLVVRATSGPPDFFLKKSGDVQPITAQGVCLKEHPFCCSVVRAECLGSHLSVPLRRGNRSIGVVCVSSREGRRFGAEEEELLAGLATQAAIAIDNARLHEEVREYGANEERRRIARDIHDGVAQSVGLLHLKIQQAQALVPPDHSSRLAGILREAVTISGGAYEEIRQSIFGLRTMVSRSLGLVPALTEFLHEFSAQSGIRVDLEAGEEPAIHLPPTSEVQVIRIVQEALTNVRKHAQASRAWVRLQRQGSFAKVIIEDNGCGWELKATPPTGPQHAGLEIMRERAEHLRGTLKIETELGRGSRVTATVPLERTT